MRLQEIMRHLEDFAPPGVAEGFDNVGLLVGDKEAEVSRIVVALDYTEAVLEYALQQQAELVVTHHPIWFGKRYNLTTEDWVGRLLLRSIKHGVNVYAMHTNLDKIRGGVNYKIAEKLGLQNIEFLVPDCKDGQAETGLGVVGEIGEMKKKEFLAHVCKVFNVPVLRYSETNKEKIRKVAVCGGSCASYLSYAIKHNADAYITGDISYHKFFDTEGKFLFIDAGHYETEQYTIELITEYLSDVFKNLLILPVQFGTNPVKYFIR